VRGFRPGLGAKSWASAGMAANQSDRSLSLATIQVLEKERVCVSQYLRFCIVSPFSCRGPNHLVSNPERITSALLNGFEPEGNGCVS
jgi:hypothetical protein